MGDREDSCVVIPDVGGAGTKIFEHRSMAKHTPKHASKGLYIGFLLLLNGRVRMTSSFYFLRYWVRFTET